MLERLVVLGAVYKGGVHMLVKEKLFEVILCRFESFVCVW